MTVSGKLRSKATGTRGRGPVREDLGFDVGAERTSWPAVEEYLAKDNRVIIPVGSQEQHGRHLPLGTDWMIPYALGRMVSARTGVFCTSPVCYGMSWLHSAFPGTVALKPGTLTAVYTEIMEELHAQGFRRMLVLNGHGGNTNALNAALSVLVRKMDDLRIKVHQWWMIPPVQEICLREFGALDSHAGPAETSLLLHLLPTVVRMEAATDNASPFLPFFPNPGQIRDLYPDGVMQNDATRANATTGDKIVDSCLSFLEAELSVGEQNEGW